jgi:hypothetical protein
MGRRLVACVLALTTKMMMVEVAPLSLQDIWSCWIRWDLSHQSNAVHLMNHRTNDIGFAGRKYGCSKMFPEQTNIFSIRTWQHSHLLSIASIHEANKDANGMI